MRSIGKVKIRKLKKLTADMWKKNNHVSENEVICNVPFEWFDTWESAWSEIHRIVGDELRDLTYNNSRTSFVTLLGRN